MDSTDYQNRAVVMSTHREQLSVGVLVFANAMALDLVGPVAYLELLRKLGVRVAFHTVSFNEGAVSFAGRMPLFASTGFDDAPSSFDILVIPGGSGRQNVLKNAEFLAYIKRVAENAKVVLSVCTGSSILAAVGLLDGKQATTNKIAFDTIAAEYPAVQWKRKARWVVDGKFWTGSGVAAGLDMAHAFVTEHYGAKAAAEMARYMEIVPNTDPDNDPFEKSGETPLAFR